MVPDGGQNNSPLDTNLDEILRVANNNVNAVASLVQNATQRRQQWNATRNSMIAWLRANVGQNVNSSLSNLEDLIIASSEGTARKSTDYLKDAKTHLIQLIGNPNIDATIHDNPPRANDVDNVNYTVSQIIGWQDPSAQPVNNGN